MASGINNTLRQVGIATSVAVLGSVFASHLKRATSATLTAHYASSLDTLLLITAVVAFTAGALSIVLIRTPRLPHHRDGQPASP